MKSIMNLAKSFWKDEEGQGIIEYVLILGLIVVAAIVVMTNLGGSITSKLGLVQERVDGIQPGGPQ